MARSDDAHAAEASSEWKLPWEGGCRCGRLRFRISAPPLVTMACHCRGCQRMTASAFSLSIAVPAAGFEVTAGEPAIGGLHKADAQHFCCAFCMSWVFTRFAAMGDFVNVRSPMLDEAAWAEPFVETMTAEKLPWAATPARHAFEGFPPMEAMPGLMADYAREGKRP